jgi:PAS domain S-box-containing protein
LDGQLRIVVVDDESDLLELTHQWLEDIGGFDVCPVTSATECLKKLESAHFDAIVSDYQMPKMSGLELLKHVRSIGLMTPFILFTGKGRESVAIEALNSGADGYLQKGGDPASLYADLAHRIESTVRRRHAEDSIRESENRLTNLIEFLPVALLGVDLEGKVIIWNKAMENLTGLPAAEVLGKSEQIYTIPFYGNARPFLLDIVLGRHPEARSLYQNVVEDGGAIMAEAYCPELFGGRGAWILAKAAPLRDGAGRIIGAIESIRDISEAKNAQAVLIEANLSLSKQAKTLNVLNRVVKVANSSDGLDQLFTEVMAEIMREMDYDGGGVYLIDSSGQKADLVYSIGLPDEFTSKVNQVPVHLEPYSSLFAAGCPIISDRYDELQPGYASAGNILSMSSVPLVSKGRIIGALNVGSHRRYKVAEDEKQMLISIGQEIGGSIARMAAEEEIRSAALDMDGVFNSVAEMLFILDMNGTIITANKTVEEKLHFTQEELVGMNVLAVHVPDRRDEALRIVQGMIAGTIDACPVPVITKEGQIIEVETHVSKGHWKGREVLVGVTRDITERKRMERALHESEMHFRALFEKNAAIMLIIDPSSKAIMDSNPAAANFYGWSREQLRQMRITDISTHSEAVIGKQMGKALSEELMHGEFRHRLVDGSIRDVEVSASRFESQGRPLLFSVIYDVTKRKEMERALRQSEERYEYIFSDSPIAIELYDGAGNLIKVNKACLSLFGVQDEKEIAKFNLFADPNIEDTKKQLLRRGDRIRYEAPFDFDVVRSLGLYQTSRSGIRWLDVLIEPMRESLGGYLVQIQDITERRMAEDALRASEMKFREIFNSINDAIFITHTNGNMSPGQILEVNDIACYMLGYTREELLAMKPFDYVAGEHNPPLSVVLEQLQINRRATFETTHRRKNGTTFPVEINVHVERLGGADLNFSVVRDVTERKAAEAELLRSRKELADIIEFLPDAIVVLDGGEKVIAWNQAMEKLTGVAKADMLGKGNRDYAVALTGKRSEMLLNMLDWPDEEIRKRYLNFSRHGDTLVAEIHAENLDGGKYLWLTARPLKDQDGRRIATIESVRDITERIQAEQEMAYQLTEVYNSNEALARATADLSASESALKQASKKLAILNSITRHDVLNMLMVIDASSSMMSRSGLTPKQAENNARIERSSQTIRLQMEFAKMYQNIGVEAPMWHQLGKCVTAAARSLDLGGMEVTDETDGYSVRGDPMFEKVVYNLIDNALRHSGGAKHMVFEAGERDGSLLIVARDDGKGISAEDREHLFERGYGKNTGFGLFLSREILAITGMTIDERGGGGGARFEIVVPSGDWRC